MPETARGVARIMFGKIPQTYCRQIRKVHVHFDPCKNTPYHRFIVGGTYTDMQSDARTGDETKVTILLYTTSISKL